MSTSLYYQAVRPTPLSAEEESVIEAITARANDEFPFDYEVLCFYASDEPNELLNGSTKISMEIDEVLPSVAYWCAAVTELRRALPDAEWSFALDDEDVEWSAETGYSLPGMGEDLGSE